MRLPKGAEDPQDAILMLDRQMADYARSGNPGLMKHIPFFEDWRDRIAKQSEPLRVGNALVDPRSGRTIYQPTIGAFSPALSMRRLKPITKAEGSRRI